MLDRDEGPDARRPGGRHPRIEARGLVREAERVPFDGDTAVADAQAGEERVGEHLGALVAVADDGRGGLGRGGREGEGEQAGESEEERARGHRDLRDRGAGRRRPEGSGLERAGMVRIGAFALMLKGRKAAFTGARSCRSGRPGAERASRRAALTDADCADPPGATRIAPSRTSGVGPASPQV